MITQSGENIKTFAMSSISGDSVTVQVHNCSGWMTLLPARLREEIQIEQADTVTVTQTLLPSRELQYRYPLHNYPLI